MLKRFLVTLVVLVGAIGGVWVIGVTKGTGVAPLPDTGLSYQKPSQLKELLAPVYLPPKTINIPKLGLNREISVVGVVEGRIGVPADWQGVGYFSGSSKVGENGNTIIVGHLDDNLGRPAAFWAIRSLAAGDEIILGDGHRSFTYRVLESAFVPDGSGEVLQEGLGGPGLILVTCGGTWSMVTHSYSQRLLVKARLVGG